MKTTATSLLNFLGLGVQGDLGGITCYRSKRGCMIWYPKAPPRTKPSALQQSYRDRWASYINDWKDLTPSARLNWLLLATSAHLSINGLNLYIAWRASQDDSFIHTIERQTGITVI